ncbi:unnamed protein product [Blepharisma stoltei]|uniref:FHA domain-containing protein n=1 Tax=Blepharisma stoltei TaxID=1481888 RepID=A0AAU9JMQ3_9CILI|nr:unnamed protein product [Blepharisma stoltei]
MKKEQSIYASTFTWSRDSHGLFDYESSHISKKLFKITENSKIVRAGNETHIQAHNSELANSSLLLSVNPIRYHAVINSAEQESLWLALRNYKSSSQPKTYTLKENDIIKLGRLKFRVCSLNNDLIEPITQEAINPENTENVCRICLCDTNEPNNPLISPCMCSGTMKYIHVLCLQKWISSKLSTKEGENSVIYCWKSMDCELCKQPFPTKVKSGRKTYEIFIAEGITTPYIVLEAMNKDHNSHRYLYLVSFMNKCIAVLGRGHDSDVRISDISVSRSHASIKYEGGNFLLEDNISKFGTLVKLEESYKLSYESELMLQVGRTLVEFSNKKRNLND